MSPSTKSQNLTGKYALIQGFFWMNFAAVMGFTSIYLLNAGFSNTQIGIIMAVAGIISAVLQPWVAGYADKPSSPSLKKIVLFIGAAELTLAVLLLLFYKRSLLLTGLFYGGSITLLQLLNPLVNSLGMESLNQGKNVNFGVSRGMGSAAYAVAAYLLGIVVAKLGVLSIPGSMVIGFAVFVLALVIFPFKKRSSSAVEKEAAASGGPLYFFKKYKRFSVVLFGWILIYISHVLLNSFTFQIVESKGGGSAEMGVSMAMSALIELPTLFLFVYMLKKVECHVWFRISGIFFTLKSLGTLLAPSIPVFYAVQFLQMFGWALITVSSVYYVNSIMEPEDAIKGQAYMTMTYTLGSVLAALIGGALIDKAGVNTMLVFSTVSAAVGMVIVLLMAEKAPKR